MELVSALMVYTVSVISAYDRATSHNLRDVRSRQMYKMFIHMAGVDLSSKIDGCLF